MIKAIVFDIGGVLFRPGMLSDLFKDLAKKNKADFEQMRIVFRKYWNEGKVGKISEKDLWKGFISEMNFPYTVEEFQKIVYDHFTPNEGTFEIVRSLKGKYTLGILSNTIEDWYEYQAKKSEFEQFFDVIVTSYEAGWAKPEREIYQRLVDDLQLKPEEVFFVDDQIQNVVAAKGFGLRATVFDSPEQLKKALSEEGVSA